MAADALSDVLKTVRLTGAAYFDIAAQEPWSVHSPARDQILPRILPGADHLIAYHVVTAGRCFASLDGGEAVPLEAGEVVMFTNADPHVMSSSAGMRADPPTADMIDIAEAGHLPFHVNLMNGGAVSAKLVCGYLACDSRPFNPLLEALPPMLKAGPGLYAGPTSHASARRRIDLYRRSVVTSVGERQRHPVSHRGERRRAACPAPARLP